MGALGCGKSLERDREVVAPLFSGLWGRDADIGRLRDFTLGRERT
ncbi:MAG: hypothetical protein PHF19_00255 [Synergistales bacterium]|jgi:hypothetical protein|nr:hypothetical protein [Synergistales bacterium]